MLNRKFISILTAALAILFLFQNEVQAGKPTVSSESTVTIPLTDYLSLIEQKEEELVFSSVEGVYITGEYRKPLAISFVGSSSTKPMEVIVMNYDSNFAISSCSGNAALSLRNSQVVILPQAKRFKLNCKLTISNWQEPRFVFTNVLAADATVKGVEVMYEPGGDSEKQLVFYRKDREVASVVEEEPSFVSHYRLTLLQDENRFEYTFNIENPNAKAKSFIYTPAKNEIIKSVSAKVKHEEAAGAYTFTLPPGSTHIRINGRVTDDAWVAPIKKGLNYLLVEQHPLLTTEITTTAKRISNQDVHMHSSFPVSRAYLLDAKDNLKWTKSALESFAATTYTINQANYNYYWSKSGKSLVEASYWINNQGALEIPLSIPGTPTYMEINGRAQVLSKTKDNQLMLNVPTGDNQSVLVQYKVEDTAPRFMASLSSQLPKPDATISNVAVSLQLPKNHMNLFVNNGGDWDVTIGWFQVLKALFLFLVLFKFLKHIQIRYAYVLVVSIGISFLTLFFPSAFGMTLLAVFGATLIANRHRVATFKPTSWKVYARYAVYALIVYGFWVGMQSFSQFNADNDEYYSHRRGTAANIASMPASTFGGRQERTLSKSMPMADEAIIGQTAVTAPVTADAPSDGIYNGIPVRIQIPQEGRVLHFQRGFMDQDTKLDFMAMSFNTTILEAMMALVLLICALCFWRERQKFIAYMRVGAPI